MFNEINKKSSEYPVLLIYNSNNTNSININELYKKQINDLEIKLFNREDIKNNDILSKENNNDIFNNMLKTFNFNLFFKLLNSNNTIASSILFSNKVTSTQKIMLQY